jgi:hypothetical protein
MSDMDLNQRDWALAVKVARLAPLSGVTTMQSETAIAMDVVLKSQAAEIERLRALLGEAHEAVEALMCSSTWRTGEPRPHCDLCKRIDAALAKQKEGPV